MYPANQSFLVLGLSRSGVAAAEFLLSEGAETYVFDDVRGGAVEKAVQSLTEKGAKTVNESLLPELINRCHALVLSPGIPVDHPLAVAFKRAGKAVIGETELAARYLKCCVLAVTGTNGKTTTVSMLAEISACRCFPAVIFLNATSPWRKSLRFSWKRSRRSSRISRRF